MVNIGLFLESSEAMEVEVGGSEKQGPVNEVAEMDWIMEEDSMILNVLGEEESGLIIEK